MPKTILIVQPTVKRKPKEIAERRKKIAETLSDKGYFVLNPEYGAVGEQSDSVEILMIGEDIKKLGIAECVLFCDGWKEDRGCCAIYWLCECYKKTMLGERQFKEDRQ